MEIRYIATPADIDMGLRHSKRVSTALWIQSVLLGLLALLTGFLILHRVTLLLATTTALYLLLVRLWYMPWILRRKVKKGERVLTVGDEGIWTKIASKERQYSWSEIAEFYSDDKAIILVRTNGNFFSVPSRAFADEKDRNLFIGQCRKSLGLVQ